MEDSRFMRILMCRPDYYGIEYEINPWMKITQKSNHSLALNQWENLYNTIKHCGAMVELVSPVSGWPDMTFTANAGLLYQNKIILAHFKYKERQGEEPYFKEWFEQAGFQIIEKNDHFFEGAGDALFAGNKLFAGYGFRTDRAFYETAPYFDQTNLIYCELQDPYFYHIDTCFCPINDQLAIWFPDAFTEPSKKIMSEKIELVPVIEEEAKRFACNAVVINNDIILPTGCPQISAILEKRGFSTHACDMSDFLKAGGACKCLTLRLD